MLLRRMIEHLRNQNWVAVWLDLMIVIVGVFIAIQVERWYEQRRILAESQVQLAALAEDFAANRERLEHNLARHNEVARSAIRLARIDSSSGDAVDHGEFYRLLGTSDYRGRFQPQLAAYESLVSSGRINVIADEGLKGDLARFYASVNGLESAQHQGFNSIISEAWDPYVTRELDRAMLLRYAHPESMGDLKPVHDTDRYREALGSEEFRNVLLAKYHWSHDILGTYKGLLDQVLSIEAALAQYESQPSDSTADDSDEAPEN